MEKIIRISEIIFLLSVFMFCACSKDNKDEEYYPSTVTDIDGNVYPTILIGNQLWMKENLRVSNYRNGDEIGTTIPAIKDISGESESKYQWSWKYPIIDFANSFQPVISAGYGNLTLGQCVDAGLMTQIQKQIIEWNLSYLSISSSGSISQIVNSINAFANSFPVEYDLLYTWYAIMDERGVCPTGWHVPAKSEWTTLTDYLGGENEAGSKMKETGNTHWLSPLTIASNTSGFTALPGGYRSSDGSFNLIGYNGDWWSSTEYNTTQAWVLDMYYEVSYVSIESRNKSYGFSIRCIKD
jgi:uncharacterized protein (TIGR02145 family)